jgi:protein O-GlcNAc transferase
MNSAPFVANPTPLISHTLLGIPQGAPFCTVLGRIFKLHPTFDLVLAHILTAVPKAYVVVVAERTYHLNQQFMNRLHVTMMDFPGTRERVVFTEFQYYNHMLNQAACVLDTFPYGGCLTTHDAVSNSVPLVTLPLEHVRGRYSLSMYSQMGHTDLVAANESHYVDIAVRLLTDVAFNEAQRVKIKEGYTTRLHRNPEVLDEWMSMLHKLTR